MNSSWSWGGSAKRPAFQSAFACSIRSREEETKFHHTCRGPIGSPPSSITVAGSSAVTGIGVAGREHQHAPGVVAPPSTSTAPAAT